MKNKQEESELIGKTSITINCKDGTKRVITVIGQRNVGFAESLGKDLETSNYSSVSIKHL